MNTRAVASVLDFEIYLLGTMKYGMLNREATLEAKLADFGLDFEDAEKTRQRVGEVLSDESASFTNLTQIVGVAHDGSRSLAFRGVLWPDFDFVATTIDGGRLTTARYLRARGQLTALASPLDQPAWSMDTADFAASFGPTTVTHTSSLFDDALPAHEYHEFEWNGQQYGAGFSWGLFLFASQRWT